MSEHNLSPQGAAAVRLATTTAGLRAEVADLKSRLACVAEATYWDRPYDERIAAIRGMCDLTTNGFKGHEEYLEADQ